MVGLDFHLLDRDSRSERGALGARKVKLCSFPHFAATCSSGAEMMIGGGTKEAWVIDISKTNV